MQINSNMSPREAFRFYGQLPESLIEQLLDDSEFAEENQNAIPLIYEAKAQFPNEDFAQDIISELQFIAKRLRGNNREELLDTIRNLEKLQSEIARESEYGHRELASALAILETPT